MGTIISIAGHQGGAGKTTTTLNLGIGLAQLGQKVLLIDTDPLGSMAVASALSDQSSEGLVQLLRGRDQAQVIRDCALDLPLAVLANGVQQPADAFFLEQQAKKGALGRLLDQLGSDYDYVLIDTPGSIEAISAMVFAHCHSVILALPCQSNAIKTLPILLRLLKRVQDKLQPELHILGILASHFDSQNPYELDVLAAIRLSFPQGIFFSTIIPRSGQFEKAASQAIPLHLFPDNNGISHLYSQLAEEVMTRLSTASHQGPHNAQPERLF